MDADSYRRSTMSPEEAAEHDRVYGGLAQRTRELMEAQLLTEVDHDEVAAIGDQLAALTERLKATARTDPHGVEVGPGGRIRNFGNAVVGLRNPIAPPVKVERSPDGRAWASFRLGPLFEGPPGLVHGGVTALLLDQLCGEAAAAGSSPGMTARLDLSYRRPTPLGELSGEAWIDDVDGHKTTVKGHICDAEGRPTVEAEGLFILPRWAREAMAASRERPDSFE